MNVAMRGVEDELEPDSPFSSTATFGGGDDPEEGGMRIMLFFPGQPRPLIVEVRNGSATARWAPLTPLEIEGSDADSPVVTAGGVDAQCGPELLPNSTPTQVVFLRTFPSTMATHTQPGELRAP